MSCSGVSASALLLAAVLAGCGDSSSSITNPPPPPSGPPLMSAVVEVRNDFFASQTVLLAAGGQVTWTWMGQNHNVTSVLSPAFTPNSATENAPFSHGPITFTTPGTYRYICTIHGAVVNGQPTGMHGVIVVQ